MAEAFEVTFKQLEQKRERRMVAIANMLYSVWDITLIHRWRDHETPEQYKERDLPELQRTKL